MGVPPNHPFKGLSLINHPFWGSLIYGNLHISTCKNRLYDTVQPLLVFLVGPGSLGIVKVLVGHSFCHVGLLACG